MPPLRGSDLTTFGGSAAIIDGLLRGENIRRARKDEALQQQVVEQRIAESEAKEKQVLFQLEQAEKASAFQEATQIQDFESEIAAGLRVLEEGTMLDGPSGDGQQIPASVKGVGLQAQTPLGLLQISQAEAEELNKVNIKRSTVQRIQKRENSLDASFGSIISAREAADGRIRSDTERQLLTDELKRGYQLEVVQPREDNVREAVQTNEMLRIGARNAYRAKVGDIGNAAEVDDLVHQFNTGQITKIPSSQKHLQGAVNARLVDGDIRIVSSTQMKNLAEITARMNNLDLLLGEAAFIFEQDNAITGGIKANVPVINRFTDAGDVQRRLLAAQTALAKTAGEIRVTNMDAFRFGEAQTPKAFTSDVFNREKVEDFRIRTGNAVRGVIPGITEEQILAIAPDLAPFLKAANDAAKESKFVRTLESAESSAQLQEFSDFLDTPKGQEILNQSGLTKGKALEKFKSSLGGSNGQ